MNNISVNPYGNLYNTSNISASDASADRLSNTLSGDLSNATDEELMAVCKDFEAYFVEQVMKEMKKMIPKPENKDASMGQLRDYFEEEMIQEYAKKTTESTDLGIAQTLYEQMKRNYNL